jgi:uncharacterized membrane protein YccC
MANQVRITSIDALESFRANLIVFATKARGSLDGVADQVVRTRVWLQNDQRMHWEGEVRRRKKLLEQAEQDLYNARLSGLRDTAAVQQAAVHKAKRALAEAEDKLGKVKRWAQRFGGCAEPLMKRLERLRQLLEQELPGGITYLAQVQRTLEAYTDVEYSPSEASPTSESSEPQ